MAIAYGGFTQADNTGSATLSFTGPTITGNNTIGVVMVHSYTTAEISITWGGVNMTQVDSITNSLVYNNLRLSLFYILNPSSDGTVVVTRGSNSFWIRATAAYYTGAKQSEQPDASANNKSISGTSLSTSVTTVADNCWTILAFQDDNGSGTAGTNCTQRGTMKYYDSNAALTPAGSKTMTVTGLNMSGSEEGDAIMMSISPSPTPNFFNFI